MTAGDRFEHIAVEESGSILTVTLDRPEKLNAATPQMLDELIEVFSTRATAEDVRAVIVTGRGRGFCSGADLVEDRPDLAGIAREDYRDGGGRVTLSVFAQDKPVIAAINGPAVGFGVTLTLPMDIRLASSSARFAFPFTRRGIVPEGCSSWFLPRLVGMSRALDWTTTGRMLGAQEALEGGLLNSVHPEDELLEAARALAVDLVENTSPVSVAMTRRMLWRMQAATSPHEAHLLESLMLYDRTAAADSDEGMSAFMEKRPARFPGRVDTDLPKELR